jgi:hypothetical protein
MSLRLVTPPDENAAPASPSESAGAAVSFITTKTATPQGFSLRVDPQLADRFAEIRRFVHDPGEEALEELWVGLTLDPARVVPNLRRLASIGELARLLYLQLEGRA